MEILWNFLEHQEVITSDEDEVKMEWRNWHVRIVKGKWDETGFIDAFRLRLLGILRKGSMKVKIRYLMRHKSFLCRDCWTFRLNSDNSFYGAITQQFFSIQYKQSILPTEKKPPSS